MTWDSLHVLALICRRFGSQVRSSDGVGRGTPINSMPVRIPLRRIQGNRITITNKAIGKKSTLVRVQNVCLNGCLKACTLAGIPTRTHITQLTSSGTLSLSFGCDANGTNVKR